MASVTIRERLIARLVQCEQDFAEVFQAFRAEPSVDNRTALRVARANLAEALKEVRDAADEPIT